MPRQKILKEEDLENLDELRAHLDDILQKTESKTAQERILKQQVEEKRQQFNSLKDNYVSLKDAKSQVQEKVSMQKKELDALESEKLELEEKLFEYQNILAAAKTMNEEDWQRLDTDGDGQISAKEWIDAYKADVDVETEEMPENSQSWFATFLQQEAEAIEGADDKIDETLPNKAQLEVDVEMMRKAAAEAAEIASYESIENGGEVIVEHSTLGPKIFHIPAWYTFGMLLRDVTSFYDEDESEFYFATKKGIVWTSKSLVLDSMVKFDKEMSHYEEFEPEDLYVQLKKKPPPPPPAEPPYVPRKPKPKKKNQLIKMSGIDWLVLLLEQNVSRQQNAVNCCSTSSMSQPS